MVDIHYHNCTFAYQGTEILSDYSFHIKQGKHAIILGPIGSGKTMLLRSLAGNTQLKSGEVTFHYKGKELSKSNFHQKVSLVEFVKPSKLFNPNNHFYQQRYHHQMEDDQSSKSMTIEALLKLMGFSINDQKVHQFLERENLLNQFHSKLIQLSSGQRRKLQLIVSLLSLPEVLLLDSPYIGLDAESRNDLNEWLLELVEEKNLQIILSADERDAPAWIYKRITLPSRSSTFTTSPDSFGPLIKAWNKNDIQKSIIPMLELENININYGRIKVLNELNWRVNQGERVALIGKNGSGKSTLLSLIYADNPKAYCNSIRLFGTQRGKGDNIWSIKKRIGFVSSELHLYFTEKYTCFKVIATGFFDTKFITRKLYHYETEIIEAYINYFGLSHLLNREYAKTSLGEQKITLFIRALVKNPELLLLDEPYQGFDVGFIEKANKLLNAMVNYSNTTLIFISHYRNEIPGCIDRIYHLTDGKIREAKKKTFSTSTQTTKKIIVNWLRIRFSMPFWMRDPLK